MTKEEIIDFAEQYLGIELTWYQKILILGYIKSNINWRVK